MATTSIQNKTAEIAKVNAQGKKMDDYVKALAPEIRKALPMVMTEERFTRIVLTALNKTPELRNCTPASFLGAMMTSAQLGLEINSPLGLAYVLPYKNNKKVKDATGKEVWVTQMEAQFQLGYRGMIDLAYRGGDVELIQAHIVYENDTFEFEYGLDPQLKHIPAKSNRGAMTYAYAMFKTKSGGFGFEVMSVEDLREFAKKYSKSSGSSYSPWQTNPEEMYKKTVLKKVLKYAPLRSDFVKAVAQDESIKTEISDDMYSVPNEMVFEDVEFTEVESEVADGKAE